MLYKFLKHTSPALTVMTWGVKFAPTEYASLWPAKNEKSNVILTQNSLIASTQILQSNFHLNFWNANPVTVSHNKCNWMYITLWNMDLQVRGYTYHADEVLNWWRVKTTVYSLLIHISEYIKKGPVKWFTQSINVVLKEKRIPKCLRLGLLRVEEK